MHLCAQDTYTDGSSGTVCSNCTVQLCYLYYSSTVGLGWDTMPSNAPQQGEDEWTQLQPAARGNPQAWFWTKAGYEACTARDSVQALCWGKKLILGVRIWDACSPWGTVVTGREHKESLWVLSGSGSRPACWWHGGIDFSKPKSGTMCTFCRLYFN